jgi:hypothetical protein
MVTVGVVRCERVVYAVVDQEQVRLASLHAVLCKKQRCIRKDEEVNTVMDSPSRSFTVVSRTIKWEGFSGVSYG